MLAGIGFDPADDRRKEMGDQVRHNHSDGSGVLPKQSHGQWIGAVVPFFGQLFHPCLHLRADVGMVLQGP